MFKFLKNDDPAPIATCYFETLCIGDVFAYHSAIQEYGLGSDLTLLLMKINEREAITLNDEDGPSVQGVPLTKQYVKVSLTVSKIELA